jgi:thiamine kinase-like enzyme
MLPSFESLSFHMQKLFTDKGFSDVKVLSRQAATSTTFPTEIIECEVDGQKKLVFCKYQNGLDANNHGHRGAVPYESMVYQEIISQTPLSHVPFHGTCSLPGKNEMWMVLDYLENAATASHVKNGMEKAASWIAKFHRHHQFNSNPKLTRYNQAYYYVWLIKMQHAFETLYLKFPWLPTIIEYYKNNISCLFDSPASTVIHGEYYTLNILIQDGVVYPVDWESAAIAAGEIDLASLIDGWDKENTIKFIGLYTSTRWPDGNFSYDDFIKRLSVAQMYFHFRWLAAIPLKQPFHWRYQKLFELGRSLGLFNGEMTNQIKSDDSSLHF